MGRRSKISQNPEVERAVNQAIERGCTVSAITEMVNAMGLEIARSSIGEHVSKYNVLAQRQRDIRSAADAFAGEFGNADDNQTRLMIQLVTTLITENIMSKGQGEGSAMDLRLLSAAVKDAIGAAKIDDDRRRSLRKEAFAEAAKVAETAARKSGASEESINIIKKQILGIEA